MVHDGTELARLATEVAMVEVTCPDGDCGESLVHWRLVAHLHRAHGHDYDDAGVLAEDAMPDAVLDAHDDAVLVDLYRTMRRIRRVEETVKQLGDEGAVPGNPHLCIGQEAVAAGVCGALRDEDVIGSTWRGHGHLLAKGVTVGDMLAEIAGNADGLNGGRAGTMHMADLSVGAIGQNGIVGASASHVAGGALAHVLDGGDGVGAAFFSDGALNEGIVPETMNLAAIWDLPVIFACENNGYAVTTTADYSVANAEHVPARAEALGMAADTVDGQDAVSVFDAAREAVERGRNGGGPTFLEFRTYRFSGHFAAEDSMLGEEESYRPADEVEGWTANRDPIERLGARLTDAGVLSEDERAEVDAEIEETIQAAIERVEAGERPPAEDALTNVYGDADYPDTPAGRYR